MARFDVTGMEQTIKSMAQMGESVGPVADAMLHTAGKLVVEGWQYSLAKHGHVNTGALYDSIKASKPKTIGGVRAIIISPRGTDKKDRIKPVRNAQKGSVLNYGRRNMAASHWAEEATKITEEPAIEAMENLWDDWIWQGTLPAAGDDWAESIAWVSSDSQIGAATFHQG